MTPARAGSCAAALVALATLYAGIHWGSTVGGGADSYGYVSQAALWQAGTLRLHEPIARQSPWPSAIETWAPLGYRPAPGSRDTIVPLYASGLPLLMALFQTIGGFCAAFLVVPVSGAVAVWLTYVLALRMFGSASAAVGAAVLVTTSPVFLYQLMNPMSDVPAAAAWTLAIVLAIAGRPFSAGLVAGIALSIRPNLAAVAVALVVWSIAARHGVVRLILGMLPAVAAVSATNLALYGAPWMSGYGSVADLYDPRYLATNVRQFGAWMIATQTPAVALAAVCLAFPRACLPARLPHPRLLAAGTMAAVVISYVFYIPFDAWWYLRFLLPMWPMMMVLVAVSSLRIVEALAARFSPSAARGSIAGATWIVWITWGIVIAGLAGNGVRIAVDRSVFDIGRSERKYIDVARFVAGHTDAEAIMISLQHSGSLRLYGGRLTLRFDQLRGPWLDRTVAFLRDRGRHPYIVLEGGEVDLFKRQFADNEIGRLDWHPMAESTDPRIVIYDAVDRASTREPLAIATSAPRRAGWRCERP